MFLLRFMLISLLVSVVSYQYGLDVAMVYAKEAFYALLYTVSVGECYSVVVMCVNVLYWTKCLRYVCPNRNYPTVKEELGALVPPDTEHYVYYNYTFSILASSLALCINYLEIVYNIIVIFHTSGPTPQVAQLGCAYVRLMQYYCLGASLSFPRASRLGY